MEAEVNDAMRYLREGGIAEVEGLARICEEHGAPKVSMDTDMAIALCQLAAIGAMRTS